MSAAFIGGRVFSPITLLTRAGFGYCEPKRQNYNLSQRHVTKSFFLWRLTCETYLCMLLVGALCVIHMWVLHVKGLLYRFNANVWWVLKNLAGKINQVKIQVIICVKQPYVCLNEPISFSQKYQPNLKKQQKFFLKRTFFCCRFGAVFVGRCKLHHKAVQVAPQLYHLYFMFFRISRLFFSNCGVRFLIFARIERLFVQIFWNCWENFVWFSYMRRVRLVRLTCVFILGVLRVLHTSEVYMWNLLVVISQVKVIVV